MNYVYILEVFDPETDEKVAHIEGFSEESLLEKIGHVDSSIKEYEGTKEAEAQMEIDRQKEEE